MIEHPRSRFRRVLQAAMRPFHRLYAWGRWRLFGDDELEDPHFFNVEPLASVLDGWIGVACAYLTLYCGQFGWKPRFHHLSEKRYRLVADLAALPSYPSYQERWKKRHDDLRTWAEDEAERWGRVEEERWQDWEERYRDYWSCTDEQRKQVPPEKVRQLRLERKLFSVDLEIEELEALAYRHRAMLRSWRQAAFIFAVRLLIFFLLAWLTMGSIPWPLVMGLSILSTHLRIVRLDELWNTNLIVELQIAEELGLKEGRPESFLARQFFPKRCRTGGETVQRLTDLDD